MERWRHKQLLDDVKAKERYWKFKGEATDRSPSRTRLALEEAMDLSSERLRN